METTTETEARELQAEIETMQADQAVKKAAAKELRQTLLASGDSPEVGSPEFKDIEAAWQAADDVGEKVAEAQSTLNATLIEGLAGLRKSSASTKLAKLSYGERFLAHEAYKAKVSALAGRGFGENDRLPTIEVATAAETVELYLASTDGSAQIPTDERLTTIELPSRRQRLIDMITKTSTSSDAVQIIREVLDDGQASNIAHSSAGAEGDPIVEVGSPVSEFRLARATLTVKRIATHTKQPRSMLSDAPRLENHINNRLRRTVIKNTERGILAGDDSDEEFNGILNQAGSNQNHSNAGSVPLADSMHMAMTMVRIAYEDDISALVMHPTDYQDFVLAKSEANHYQNGVNPFMGTPMTAWGYPVVVSTVVPVGTILAGDMAQAVLYVREGIQVFSGLVDDQLIKDAVTIAAEYRAAFGVDLAQAFATVTRVA